MKYLILTLALLVNLSVIAQHGKATTIKKTFSRTTTITEFIHSDFPTVWSLLTNAEDYTTWNSTVVSLEGKIAEGEKIRLVGTLAPDRTFKLKVKEMTPNKKLVWGDGMGKRTYTLEQDPGGEEGVLFTMTERIGSFMFPLFANKIPSFDGSFEQFTSDLKKAAENITK